MFTIAVWLAGVLPQVVLEILPFTSGASFLRLAHPAVFLIVSVGQSSACGLLD